MVFVDVWPPIVMPLISPWPRHDLDQRGMLSPGVENLAVPLMLKDLMDAITTPLVSPSGWQAVAACVIENGIAAVQDRMHFHVHATILSLDHQDLTYEYAGRDFRLTDVFGNVAHEA